VSVRAAVVAPLLCGAVASLALADVPRGRPATRPQATHVVVRETELQAEGLRVRVFPGVGVAVRWPPTRGRVVAATLTGPVELSGQLDGAALGLRVQRDVPLRDARGRVLVGSARAGALVHLRGEGTAGATIEPTGGIRGRFVVAREALGPDLVELVLPVPEGVVAIVRTAAPLREGRQARAAIVAQLEAGARIDVLSRSEDGRAVRGRTYGGLLIEGWIAAQALSTEVPATPQAPPRGPPTHEALVDVPAFADAGGRRRVGTLRGGALVTLGIEATGDRGRVTPHGGQVQAQLWVPLGGLRALEASVWAEGL
jgi:hypothetical protein